MGGEKKNASCNRETVARKAGRTEKNLAEKIAADVAKELSVELGDVSVAFEEVERTDWEQEVYRKDICEKPDCIYKKPDYTY